MKIELSKFKKVHDGESSAILERPDGIKITIPKAILSDEFRSKLKDLPLHMKDGGDVPGEEKKPSKDELYNQQVQQEYEHSKQVRDELAPKNALDRILMGKPASDEALLQEAQQNQLNKLTTQQQTDEAAQQAAADQNKSHYQHDLAYVQAQNDQRQKVGLSPLPLPVDASAAQQPQQMAPSPQAQAPNTQPAVQTQRAQAAPQPQDLYSQGYQGQVAGLKAEAKAEAEAGQQTAKALEAHNQQLETAKDTYNTLYQQHDQAIQGHQVDPNHFWANKTTGGKVSTIIGLILGGMGGGLTGQENPALKLLQDQMSKDVESQQRNLSSEEQRMTNMHNWQSTTNALALQQVKNEVERIGANAKGPLAQARLQQLKGQLDQQYSQNIHALTLNQMLNSGQVPAGAEGYLTPEQRERVVKMPPQKDGSQTLRVANSKEDAESLRKSFNQYDAIQSKIEDMRAFKKDHGVTAPMSDANRSGARLQEELQNLIRELWGIKRLSPELGLKLEKAIPHPGQFRQDDVSNSLNDLEHHISQMKQTDANSLLSGPNLAPSSAPAAPNFAAPNLKGRTAKR